MNIYDVIDVNGTASVVHADFVYQKEGLLVFGIGTRGSLENAAMWDAGRVLSNALRAMRGL